MRACNQNIIKTLKLVEDMIELASQGDAEREDTGCGVLYGIMLDSAYKIRQIAEKEKQAKEDTLQKLLIQKRRSQIKAPYDGIILTKDVDVGAWVQQGKKLVSIGSSSDLYVRAPVAENFLQFIEVALA